MTLTNLGIKHQVTSVEHPQSNGQIDAANKVMPEEEKSESEKEKEIELRSFRPSYGLIIALRSRQ